ncbi:MAG: hypothetical protein EBZ91_08300 [Gammaproteobacteria bacterium]|nr:hypothetical protein [Gammaproteobacteria bacterium]
MPEQVNIDMSTSLEGLVADVLRLEALYGDLISVPDEERLPLGYELLLDLAQRIMALEEAVYGETGI